MKTKLNLFACIACALTLASFASAEEGFYEKDHVRGFISIGGDYRGMFEHFQNYVNTTAFVNGGHIIQAPKEETTEGAASSTEQEVFVGNLKYPKFDDYYIGLHLNFGAQYKQFLTWIGVNFMPTQVSERPSSTYTTTSEQGNSAQFPLYDVKWFSYGAEWMFGWKLFGENTIINLIPAVGVGFNLINFHLASTFDIQHDGSSNITNLRDRYYSTMAATFNSELELRIELGQFAIGAYGGYRFIRYNELSVEGDVLEPAYGKYDTDNVGDTWFVGLRLTWTFLSDWQRKQQNRL